MRLPNERSDAALQFVCQIDIYARTRIRLSFSIRRFHRFSQINSKLKRYRQHKSATVVSKLEELASGPF
jgi:hypothetical protein